MLSIYPSAEFRSVIIAVSLSAILDEGRLSPIALRLIEMQLCLHLRGHRLPLIIISPEQFP